MTEEPPGLQDRGTGGPAAKFEAVMDAGFLPPGAALDGEAEEIFQPCTPPLIAIDRTSFSLHSKRAYSFLTFSTRSVRSICSKQKHLLRPRTKKLATARPASARLQELLLKRMRNQNMLSLVPVKPSEGMPPIREKQPMKPPPSVIVTPSDPWPRPYTIEDGLRRVAPYHFTYTTNCKMRWRGRGLLDIFESEFRDRPVAYYKRAIEEGNVTVNGAKVSLDHVVKNGDVVAHTLHRHEPPVSATPIGVIHEDDDMLVICKPAGVPVHPAGRYNYNSVVEILRAEYSGGWNPLPCNRLDRLTSGVMFIGKHPKAAEQLSKEISERTVRKEYVARVKGEFPDGDVVCDMPILQISPKLGLNRVRANGKAARTVFKKLAYYPPKQEGERDGIIATTGEEAKRPWMKKEGYSIVRCLPITGRTHQLRVHLQFLGHPISNDPIYCNQRVWGQDLGQGDADATGQSDEDIITRLARMGKEEVADAVAYHDEVVDEYQKKKAEKMSGETCDICDTPLYTDPGPQELGIYLHSLRYEDKDLKWSYRSELPEWALPPKGYEGPKEVGGLDQIVDLSKLDALEEIKDVK